MYKRWKAKAEPQGYLALVLHAHLPYVRHAERDDVMEERWFYEAMTETYLPLLDVFERLVRDGIGYRITFSVTPTLLALWTDPLMQARYAAYLDRIIGLADKETERLSDDARLRPLAVMYAERFRGLKALYEGCGRNVAAAFGRLQERGVLDLWTSAATHGYLPLMKTEEAIRAQLRTGIREHERHFGQKPAGLWLPECAYTPGIDRLLRMEGVPCFVGDASAVEYASPAPGRGLLAPLTTPYGLSVFPRDRESSEQVWSAADGYPGHVDYREFYRDIGWDLGWNDADEWEYIRPYVLSTHERVNTGMKYYRITGNGQHREPYNPEWARGAAAEQASHFLSCRARQVEAGSGWLDRRPIIVSPYDAELFGHWWYEGPIWLEMLCRQAYHDQHRVKLMTPGDYLRQYPTSDVGCINESSWGRSGTSEVWLQPANDWIYRHLHQAEDRMVALAARYAELAQQGDAAPGELGAESGPLSLSRALNQAARELLLAQSSDWAFIMDSRTVVDYAVRRTKDHLGRFNRLCGMIEDGGIDDAYVAALESRHPCFPSVDYRDYVPAQPSPAPVHVALRASSEPLDDGSEPPPATFMLAWEYPPQSVGGLSRAVADLAEALAARGEAVHVVTTEAAGAPAYEMRNGVHVHRLPVLCSGDTDFYHWTFEMNMAMVDYVVAWKERGGRLDLLHAHDWMVFHAARELKHSYGVPLVATIHATEWGRGQGRLHSELSHRIHELEWKLTYEASRVFVCSRHMKEEVVRLFGLDGEKVDIVPNGIRTAAGPDRREANPESVERVEWEAGNAEPSFGGANASEHAGSADSWARSHWFAPHDRIMLFVGRLVYEKGVQVLLSAMPSILSRVPGARLVAVGAGPMREQLERQAAELGLGERASFWGFVDDETKARLYAAADLCVFPSLYEPFGIVALEAMAARRPLVVSDTGGLAELVEHGRDGFKALPGHVESLYWHITELLLDPAAGSEMAERAYAKLEEQYNPAKIADRVQSLYDSLTHRVRRLPQTAAENAVQTI
ncbi:1,4-alpha-glucan branching protein domain-containing protein [Paenibacillus hodogayensis]|uniref:1,4-alpha-glucan branching protein domain-containing protein n=1 Tax=Paenibacillus hodogayensis TaxID=279208 RepID=A0ABV5VRE9_9BACL